MSDYVLGLDLGANSIGWALIDEANRKIIDCGVRVFPEGVNQFDTKKEKSKSEDRRVVRGMRRQIARRARRKRALRRALTAAGLLPTNEADQAAVDGLDPFVLRRRGLTERLTPHELGRALMHLNQRRGFLSNRKADRQQKDDTKGMLAEINELQKVIQDSGCETLGEFLAKELEADPLRRIRGRHTRRDMLETEFELLWERQRKHHPELLTDALKYGERGKLPGVREPLPIAKGKSPLAAYGVHGLIFFQRPMYWPKSVVGQCELEPRRKRCPRADRLAQRFRLLQEVNNLKYLDPGTKDELLLSQEQRTLLLALLSKTKEMTFDTIRKKLGFLESIPFNLERGNRSKLLGTPVDALLANKEIFGKEWHDRPEDEKTQIVRCLIHGDEGEIRRRAQAEWGLDEAATERLLNVDLPAGYSMLSIAALEKLVPHMERGLLYMTDDNTPCALLAAGYLRADQLRRQAKDQLPSPPDVANPVVRRALSELRKVVNSIIGRYGKPSAIRLEFARNATVSKEQRQEMSKRMRDREAERDGAASRLRDEYGEKVTRDKIDQYLLWEEQGKVCIYSGRPIDVSHLLGGEVHIDHILPRSRSLDNSFSNKVLCFIKHNA
ncbi:MAG TPA: type II CRISPR RNA-guided endonuclease Cas9, partial [Pirellulales bacterium]